MFNSLKEVIKVTHVVKHCFIILKRDRTMWLSLESGRYTWEGEIQRERDVPCQDQIRSDYNS